MSKFPATPAWKPPFQEALKSQPATFFQLATVSAPQIPRVRTLHLQGFLGEHPEPASSPSDLLYTTSNSHSKKFSDLSTSHVVEACFFIQPLWQQYRIRGRAITITPATEPSIVELSSRNMLECHLEADGWDWAAEVKRVWDAQDSSFKDRFARAKLEGDVPVDFRLIVIVPDEVEEYKNDAYRTWTVNTEQGVVEWAERKGH